MPWRLRKVPRVPCGSTASRLPLANLSGDPQQDYFADGMTDALITDLASIRSLRVISRQSVMRYKDSRDPVPEIARALGVDAVVEGSVARSGDRVRVTAQLIEGSTDRHLWARSYDRALGDVLGLQGELAATIAEHGHGTGSISTPSAVTRRRSTRASSR